MTQYLPANLLALFAPREPIPYLPPIDIFSNKKRCCYTGVGQFINEFEDPKDTPPIVKGETRDERKERIRREKAENIAYKLEKQIALWDPSTARNATVDPFKTLFVSRINYDTSESKLKREFEAYGPIAKITMIQNTTNGKPRGYAFIEYEHEKDMHSAYKYADGKKIDGRRVLVDVERARTVKGWLPRRLGGGLGGTRRGAPEICIKHSGREDNERERERYRIEREREERGVRSRDRDRDRDRDYGHADRDRRRSRSRDNKRRITHSKTRSRSRERDRHRDRDRDRDRDGDRDRRHKKRERNRSRDVDVDMPEPNHSYREKDKDKERKRKRSRSKERRSHKKDKKDRDRDRDRDRDHRGNDWENHDQENTHSHNRTGNNDHNQNHQQQHRGNERDHNSELDHKYDFDSGDYRKDRIKIEHDDIQIKEEPIDGPYYQ